jgi:hypothetical protein
MVTVEELRLKWPVREIPCYGNCIIIPDKWFKREWEEGLKAEGAVVLYQTLPGGTCALVRLKGRQLEPDKPKAVYQPRGKGGNMLQAIPDVIEIDRDKVDSIIDEVRKEFPKKHEPSDWRGNKPPATYDTQEVDAWFLKYFGQREAKE